MKSNNLLNFFNAKTHTPVLKTANQISKAQKPVDRSRIEKMLAAKLAKRKAKLEQANGGGDGQQFLNLSSQQPTATTSQRKPKGQPLPLPAAILSMSGVARIPAGHNTNKKYSVRLQYLDHAGGKHNKTVFFGSWGKEYYAEHEDEEKENLRFASLQRLKHEDNPLHKDFYVSRILARKGVNNIDAASILTSKEIVQQHV
jgi:hypothetical protein